MSVAGALFFPYLRGLEVSFSPEQQARLIEIATKAGTDPGLLVAKVVARYIDDEARFLAAVENGIAAAEHAESIEEEEMDARLEATFKR
jgi:predicted transcriptional regulator